MSVYDSPVDLPYLMSASALAARPNFVAYAHAVAAAGVATESSVDDLVRSATDAFEEGRRIPDGLGSAQLRGQVERIAMSGDGQGNMALPPLVAGLLAADGGPVVVDVPQQVAEAIRGATTGAASTWYLPLVAQTALWGAGEDNDITPGISTPTARVGDTFLVAKGPGPTAGPRLVVTSVVGNDFGASPASAWRRDGAVMPPNSIGLVRTADDPTWERDPGRDAVLRALTANALFTPIDTPDAHIPSIVVVGRTGSAAMQRALASRNTTGLPWQAQVAQRLGAPLGFVDSTVPSAQLVMRQLAGEVDFAEVPEPERPEIPALPTPPRPQQLPGGPIYPGGKSPAR